MSTDPLKVRLDREFKYTGPFIAARFDPAGKYIFAGTQDNSIQRIALEGGKLTKCDGHVSWMRALGFVPTPRTLVTGDYHGKLLWWPIAEEAIEKKPAPAETVAAVPVAQKSEVDKLLEGDDAEKKVETKVVDKKEAKKKGAEANAAEAKTADKKEAEKKAEDKPEVAESDAKPPVPVAITEAHEGWLRALAVSPDGKLVATCGNDNVIKLWDAAERKLVQTLKGHDCHVYNVAFHPTEPVLASADHKGQVKHWDLKTYTVVRELDAKLLNKYDPVFRAEVGGARSMTFSPDGKYLACSGMTEVTNAFAGIGKPVVVLFDWASGKMVQSLKAKDAFQGQCWGVVFHPEGYIIGVGGGAGGALWFWKPDDPLAYHTLKLPGNARDLALSPNGELLAIPFYESVLRTYTLVPPAGKVTPPAAKIDIPTAP